MTAYLADTHVLLWSLGDDPVLSRSHRDILVSDAQVFVSAASIWEIAIKRSLGKLDAPGDLMEVIARADFGRLPITFAHAAAVAALPFHHRDPFDRMLIAQAEVEGLVILTVDPQFVAYDVRLA